MEKAEFDFLLSDRIQKIQQIAKEYDLENKGYISFSGGKDSTVLSFLVDLALPNNKIPRIYSNTGIDFNAIRQFVRDMATNDTRFFILNPTQNLKKMFSEIGYPFKSKYHSHLLDVYSRQGKSGCVLKYAEPKANTPHSCPKVLQFQFNQPLPFKISDKCCYKMKKEPFKRYEKESGRTIGLTGMRRAEKGLRENINCLVFSSGALHRFHPLAPCTDEFIDQLIDEYAIPLCRLYSSPFNFKRTGCRMCVYNIHLQEEIDTLTKFAPEERRAGEYIFAPVLAEYRRLGYRLRKFSEADKDFVPKEWWEKSI
mgnify:CR=1 FL=1